MRQGAAQHRRWGSKLSWIGSAVIAMRDELIGDVPFLRKQQMQLGSKMRFMAAQFTALLEDKLWLLDRREKYIVMADPEGNEFCVEPGPVA